MTTTVAIVLSSFCRQGSLVSLTWSFQHATWKHNKFSTHRRVAEIISKLLWMRISSSHCPSSLLPSPISESPQSWSASGCSKLVIILLFRLSLTLFFWPWWELPLERVLLISVNTPGSNQRHSVDWSTQTNWWWLHRYQSAIYYTWQKPELIPELNKHGVT